MLKECPLYVQLGDKIECLVCERRCKIPEGGEGFCRTRKNIEGKLFTAFYGVVSTISANPSEKKPFFHFYPGSYALTFSTFSCNFECPWCQNWDISKRIGQGRFIPPYEMVKIALRERCQGLSVSFNEPTLLFEYSLDVFKEAKRRGLYCNFVSNGYMTEDALRMLKDAGLDAVNFDVKGGEGTVRKFCKADVRKVWRNIKLAKELGIHVEVVNLVIPTVNDEDVDEVIENHLMFAGREVPLHFTRFHPDYMMLDIPPTPIEILESAYNKAKSRGIEFVYLGNVPGHPYENTYCPSCGILLIERYVFRSKVVGLDGDTCKNCGWRIPIVLQSYSHHEKE